MKSFSNFRLYSYCWSSSSWRVRIALGLKGIPYEYCAVDNSVLAGNVTAKAPEELTRKNPLSQVPVLEMFDIHNHRVQLTQSIAIIEFLDSISDSMSAPLLPTDPLMRARARELAEIVNSGTQPMQNIDLLRRVKVVEMLNDNGQIDLVDGREFARNRVERGLRFIEKLASSAVNGSPGLFAAGTDKPSIADVCIVPQMYAARNRLKIDTTQFPVLTEICARCDELEGFKLAAPRNQPDYLPLKR